MSLRSLLPFVSVVAFAIATPAFPCEGNSSCGCKMGKGADAKADPKACDSKCDHAECAKKTEAAKADAKPAKPVAAAKVKGAKTVELTVTEKGFEPASIKLAKGKPVKLVITRKTDRTCAKQIVVKDYDINADLPLNTPVEVNLTPKAAGNVRYACAMDHVAGVLVVE